MGCGWAREGVPSVMCWVMGGRESLPVAGEKAGGRRGCQSHVNLQFSCSFFLQGEGTPNGRLRERAGRLDMVDAGGGALDSAMRWDCGRRRKLCGRCCLERCCRDRQLQVEGGDARSFGGFAEILSLLRSPGRAWPQHCEREVRRRRLLGQPQLGGEKPFPVLLEFGCEN